MGLISMRKLRAKVSRGNFVDWVQILVKGGHGGAGSKKVQWHAYTKYGLPVGGDGGKGGDVRVVSYRSITNLGNLHHEYRGGRGGMGMRNKVPGTRGQDSVIEVPLGTLVTDEEGELLCDLVAEGSEVVVARGGAGGMGNHNYNVLGKSMRLEAGLGDLGEVGRVQLEMKTIAQVGLVGFPNAGKSSLLCAISNARPKVAAYPFTTLRPYLGAVEYEDGSQIIVADIPGLIPGAHENKGLGHSFLKHIERCKGLIYVLDLDEETQKCTPEQQLEHLRDELRLYKPELVDKVSAIVANKVDLKEEFEYQMEGVDLIAISAENDLYIDKFKVMLANFVSQI